MQALVGFWQAAVVLVSFNYTDDYILNVPEGYRGGAQYAMDDSRINQITLPQWVDGDMHIQREISRHGQRPRHTWHTDESSHRQRLGIEAMHYTLSARCGAGDARSQSFKCDLDGTRR